MTIDPATLSILTKVGPPIAGGLYNKFFPNKVKQIQMEVIEGMRDRRQRLIRMSRGHFTGAERENIARGAEPGLNRLAGNLAQRGLGTSGAGAQVLGQASVLPYTQAQANAEQMVGQVDTSITAALAAVPQAPDILSGLGLLAGKFHEVEKLKMSRAEQESADTGQPATIAPDSVFEGFVSDLMKFLRAYGQGESSEMDKALANNVFTEPIRDMKGNVVGY